MVDKKLLKKIDAILVKAAHCLADENEDFQEQDGNGGTSAGAGTPAGREIPKQPEGNREVEDNEIFTGPLRERGKMPEWVYDLLLKNRLIQLRRAKKGPKGTDG